MNEVRIEECITTVNDRLAEGSRTMFQRDGFIYPTLHKILIMICCCCIVVLRPRQTSKVMSGRSVNLTTLFLGRIRPPKRLTSTSCTYFRQ